MAHAKAKDVKRVVSCLVERRVREAENNGQNGRGDVSEKRPPESWDLPVPTLPDNFVEIPAKLVSLNTQRQ